MDLDNEPQPDAYLIVLPSHAGQVQIDKRGFVAGAPELVAEVAPTSASYALHDKLNAYRRNGVQEYIVWRVFDRAIDWFVLQNGRYDPLALDPLGIYKSRVLPGLWLEPAALISGDLQAVARVAQQGVNSPDDTDFVGQLQARAPPAPHGTREYDPDFTPA